MERRGLAAQQVLANTGGRGEMIKAPINLQDRRRRLYVKAKAEPTWRFWGLYAHVCKRETLWEAYQLAKENDGAPGIDGVTFQAIEAEGLERFLEQLVRSATGFDTGGHCGARRQTGGYAGPHSAGALPGQFQRPGSSGP